MLFCNWLKFVKNFLTFVRWYLLANNWVIFGFHLNHSISYIQVVTDFVHALANVGTLHLKCWLIKLRMIQNLFCNWLHCVAEWIIKFVFISTDCIFYFFLYCLTERIIEILYFQIYKTVFWFCSFYFLTLLLKPNDCRY